jgi:hypothetical protein
LLGKETGTFLAESELVSRFRRTANEYQPPQWHAPTDHPLQPGFSLLFIAERYYGESNALAGVRAIMDANGLNVSDPWRYGLKSLTIPEFPTSE